MTDPIRGPPGSGARSPMTTSCALRSRAIFAISSAGSPKTTSVSGPAAAGTVRASASRCSSARAHRSVSILGRSWARHFGLRVGSTTCVSSSGTFRAVAITPAAWSWGRLALLKSTGTRTRLIRLATWLACTGPGLSPW